MSRNLRRMMDALYLACVVVAGIALVLISAVIPWAVFTRYVLNSAASWPEPMAVLLTIVLTFIGAAACYRRGLHMNVGFFVGMLPDPDGLLYPKQHTLFAARAAGILPMGFVGSIADFRDQEAFRAIVRRSKRLGFVGASAIHPLQVPVLNEEFSPTAAEVERAKRMVAAYDAAFAQGLGAVQFEGAMIDVPVVQRAQNVIARAAAIARRPH